MKLVHFGVTLKLPDDDPRVKVIETLLFGRPIPAPLPMPPAWSGSGESSEAVSKWQVFWGELRPVARGWLSRLHAGPVAVPRASAEAKVRKGALQGLHRHVAAAARRHGLPLPIEAKGRGRQRRYLLAAEVVEPIGALGKEGA